MTVATTLFRIDDSYARAVPGLSVPWAAAPVPTPELVVLNDELAVELFFPADDATDLLLRGGGPERARPRGCQTRPVPWWHARGDPRG